jgi:hypothetical protein
MKRFKFSFLTKKKHFKISVSFITMAIIVTAILAKGGKLTTYTGLRMVGGA